MSGAGEVLLIPVADVVVPEGRFRQLKADQAEAIGLSIAAHGQFDPITVTQLPGRTGYVLVDGWHRLEGCRIAGVETIRAQLIGAGKPQRVRHEALSGLARAAHDVLDRAAAVDALARLAREEAGLPPEGDLRVTNPRAHPATVNKETEIEIEKALLIMSKSLRWDERLADAMGVSAPAIRRLRFIHLRIEPDQKARLRKANAADELVALYQFAGLPDPAKARVLGALETNGGTLTAALAWENGEPVEAEIDPVLKTKNVFFRKVSEWTPRERANFLAEWNLRWHPDGRPRRKDERDGGERD
jgi:ParB-like chromosome segregation protein Spo0J